jgi:drug/metabolite transporter (DMT)-like permease
LFAIAEQTVSSSLAGVLNSTTPLWTVLLAVSLRTEEQLSLRRIIGVLVGFAGAVVVVEPWSGALTGSVLGMLACLAAALSYAVAYTFQGRYLTNRGVSPITLTAVQLSIAAAFLAATLPFSGSAPSVMSPVPLIAVVVLGAAGTGLALIINFTLIGSEGATAASVVTYLVPAVALMLGIAILDEPARASLPLSAALILLGVTLVRLQRLLTGVDRDSH